MARSDLNDAQLIAAMDRRLRGGGCPTLCSAPLFARRQRPDRQRVDAARQFLRQQHIDHAVAIDPALPFEGPRYDINSEMRSATRPMARVSLVKMRFIGDVEALRRESFA